MIDMTCSWNKFVKTTLNEDVRYYILGSDLKD